MIDLTIIEASGMGQTKKAKIKRLQKKALKLRREKEKKQKKLEKMKKIKGKLEEKKERERKDRKADLKRKREEKWEESEEKLMKRDKRVKSVRKQKKMMKNREKRERDEGRVKKQRDKGTGEKKEDNKQKEEDDDEDEKEDEKEEEEEESEEESDEEEEEDQEEEDEDNNSISEDDDDEDEDLSSDEESDDDEEEEENQKKGTGLVVGSWTYQQNIDKTIDGMLNEKQRMALFASLYIARFDTNREVRNEAMRVWKAFVVNPPKTVKQLLPTLLRRLSEMLSSHPSSYSQQYGINMNIKYYVGKDQPQSLSSQSADDIFGNNNNEKDLINRKSIQLSQQQQLQERREKLGIKETKDSKDNKDNQYSDDQQRVMEMIMDEENEWRKEIASECLTDLTSKAGEQTFTTLIPLISSDLTSSRSTQSVKIGACIGLSSLLAAANKSLVQTHSPSIISCIRIAICDEDPLVREQAAVAFGILWKLFNNVVLNRILPPLFQLLEGKKGLIGIVGIEEEEDQDEEDEEEESEEEESESESEEDEDEDQDDEDEDKKGKEIPKTKKEDKQKQKQSKQPQLQQQYLNAQNALWGLREIVAVNPAKIFPVYMQYIVKMKFNASTSYSGEKEKEDDEISPISQQNQQQQKKQSAQNKKGKKSEEDEMPAATEKARKKCQEAGLDHVLSLGASSSLALMSDVAGDIMSKQSLTLVPMLLETLQASDYIRVEVEKETLRLERLQKILLSKEKRLNKERQRKEKELKKKLAEKKKEKERKKKEKQRQKMKAKAKSKLAVGKKQNKDQEEDDEEEDEEDEDEEELEIKDTEEEIKLQIELEEFELKEFNLILASEVEKRMMASVRTIARGMVNSAPNLIFDEINRNMIINDEIGAVKSKDKDIKNKDNEQDKQSTQKQEKGKEGQKGKENLTLNEKMKLGQTNGNEWQKGEQWSVWLVGAIFANKMKDLIEMNPNITAEEKEKEKEREKEIQKQKEKEKKKKEKEKNKKANKSDDEEDEDKDENEESDEEEDENEESEDEEDEDEEPLRVTSDVAIEAAKSLLQLSDVDEQELQNITFEIEKEDIEIQQKEQEEAQIKNKIKNTDKNQVKDTKRNKRKSKKIEIEEESEDSDEDESNDEDEEEKIKEKQKNQKKVLRTLGITLQTSLRVILATLQQPDILEFVEDSYPIIQTAERRVKERMKIRNVDYENEDDEDEEDDYLNINMIDGKNEIEWEEEVDVDSGINEQERQILQQKRRQQRIQEYKFVQKAVKKYAYAKYPLLITSTMQGAQAMLNTLQTGLFASQTKACAAAAKSIGIFIRTTPPVILWKLIAKIAGPLIRILGQKCNAVAKVGLLGALESFMQSPVGPLLQSYVTAALPYLYHSITDPQIEVRQAGLSCFLSTVPYISRIDPVVKELKDIIIMGINIAKGIVNIQDIRGQGGGAQGSGDKVSSTILSATAFATSDPIMPDDDEIGSEYGANKMRKTKTFFNQQIKTSVKKEPTVTQLGFSLDIALKILAKVLTVHAGSITNIILQSLYPILVIEGLNACCNINNNPSSSSSSSSSSSNVTTAFGIGQGGMGVNVSVNERDGRDQQAGQDRERVGQTGAGIGQGNADNKITYPSPFATNQGFKQIMAEAVGAYGRAVGVKIFTAQQIQQQIEQQQQQQQSSSPASSLFFTLLSSTQTTLELQLVLDTLLARPVPHSLRSFMGSGGASGIGVAEMAALKKAYNSQIQSSSSSTSIQLINNYHYSTYDHQFVMLLAQGSNDVIFSPKPIIQKKDLEESKEVNKKKKNSLMDDEYEDEIEQREDNNEGEDQDKKKKEGSKWQIQSANPNEPQLKFSPVKYSFGHSQSDVDSRYIHLLSLAALLSRPSYSTSQSSTQSSTTQSSPYSLLQSAYNQQKSAYTTSAVKVAAAAIGILIPASSAAVSKQDPKAKDKDKKEGDDKMTLNINSTQIIINRASMRKGSRIVQQLSQSFSSSQPLSTLSQVSYSILTPQVLAEIACFLVVAQSEIKEHVQLAAGRAYSGLFKQPLFLTMTQEITENPEKEGAPPILSALQLFVSTRIVMFLSSIYIDVRIQIGQLMYETFEAYDKTYPLACIEIFVPLLVENTKSPNLPTHVAAESALRFICSSSPAHLDEIVQILKKSKEKPGNNIVQIENSISYLLGHRGMLCEE
ncbi:MAG: hypothetical protein EZS28_001681 [Streblomastix strix]|uniref:Uncharacterized protein n=1 Tax=Streblomastix strix TaxID=222440 RepID=A0A5J4X6D0_9EUKA|nr:MAG: hypothetical protein EZS28_001681 [Streblomastix strix]